MHTQHKLRSQKPTLQGDTLIDGTQQCNKLLRSRPFASSSSLRRFVQLSRTQDGEDNFLVQRFGPVAARVGGVVMESGALNGLLYSSTFAFERALNWSVIHIEPAPDMFEALQRHRPASAQVANFRAALCDSEKQVHFMMPEHAPAVRGIWEFMSIPFRKKWYPEYDSHSTGAPKLLSTSRHLQHSDKQRGKSHPAKYESIPCKPLRSVLPPSMNVVDIWFLDVEGAETAVLRATDFSAIQIGIIVKEKAAHPLAELESTLLLREAGFEQMGFDKGTRNSIFVNRCLAANLAQLG